MKTIYKIYKHTSPSGKIYIGQTKAINPISRWRNGGKGYYRMDKYGNYQQPAMVNAINKYPWDEWNHEIIASCDSLSDANKLEQYYIALYQSNNPKYGYNITGGGGGHYHQPMSKETKNRLSISIKRKWLDPDYLQKQKSKIHPPMHENTKKALLKANIGRKCTEETKRKIKESKLNPVLQFSLDGKLLNTFDTAKDAGLAINKTITSITNCCKGKSKKCNAYIFIFKIDFEQNPNLIAERIAKLSTRKTSAIPILQIKNGECISEYTSLTEASQLTSISVTSISNCLRQNSRSAGGYVWKYKN